MILFIHIFIATVVASKIKFWPLALILAFLSHYFLDFLPHVEYSIENIKEKKWKEAEKDFSRLATDLSSGLILAILVFYQTHANFFIILMAAFLSVLPDIFTMLFWIFPQSKFLKFHYSLHQKVHVFKDEEETIKKSSFWGRIFVQLAIIIIGFMIIA